jgi:hypothetical protein
VGPLQIPDKYHFCLLVAKAILFKKTDGIIKKLDFGAYKGNYVTYTIALLSKLTNKRIDLEKIWREQDLSPALQTFVGQLASEVRNKITDGPAGSKNISEWCKKKVLGISPENQNRNSGIIEIRTYQRRIC